MFTDNPIPIAYTKRQSLMSTLKDNGLPEDFDQVEIEKQVRNVAYPEIEGQSHQSSTMVHEAGVMLHVFVQLLSRNQQTGGQPDGTVTLEYSRQRVVYKALGQGVLDGERTLENE